MKELKDRSSSYKLSDDDKETRGYISSYVDFTGTNQWGNFLSDHESSKENIVVIDDVEKRISVVGFYR